MAAVFRGLLARVYDWLACADPVGHGDLIFALAGRQSRKIFALELFAAGRAPALLLSVGRFEIRRFADIAWPVRLDLLQVVAEVPAPKRHLFVTYSDRESSVDFVRPGKFGTLREILALAAWLGTHRDTNSLLIISSASHLRRVRMCCRNLLPASIQFRLLAVENDGPFLARETWWQEKTARMIVLWEFPKLLVYWSLLHLQRLAGPRFVLPR
jgi:hypothetical protein